MSIIPQSTTKYKVQSTTQGRKKAPYRCHSEIAHFSFFFVKTLKTRLSSKKKIAVRLSRARTKLSVPLENC